MSEADLCAALCLACGDEVSGLSEWGDAWVAAWDRHGGTPAIGARLQQLLDCNVADGLVCWDDDDWRGTRVVINRMRRWCTLPEPNL